MLGSSREFPLSATSGAPQSTQPLKTRLRPWLRHMAPRFALAAFVFLAALKTADFGLGWLARSPDRHRLRLAPHAELRHKSKEFDYLFRTNDRGFRGPNVSFAKPSDVYRIVVIGDSFVAGYGVDEKDLMTGILERTLVNNETSKGKRIEVVNLGRVGSSTIREFDLYETLGRRYEPDLVILAYYLGNDLPEVDQEQTDEELARWHPPGVVRSLAYLALPNIYLELAMLRQSSKQLREFQSRSENEIAGDIRQEAVARQKDPDVAESQFRSLPPEIRADVAAGNLSEQRIVDSCIEPDRLVRALDPKEADFARSWGRTEMHLSRLAKAVSRDGARLAVVVIPASFQLDRQSWEFHRKLGYDAYESWLTATPRTTKGVVAWCGHHQVPVLDLADDFRNSSELLYYVEDGHFNPQGHARAAAALAKFLREQRLTP